MRRRSRFISNQLVTLGVLMCLLGVSLEVAVLAKQGPPPPPVPVPCDSRCEWSQGNNYCGAVAPPCGVHNTYCQGNPYLPICTACLCSDPTLLGICDCW